MDEPYQTSAAFSGEAQLIGFCFLAGKSLRYPTPLIAVPGHVAALVKLAVGEATVFRFG
jgi:hypothetical protein